MCWMQQDSLSNWEGTTILYSYILTVSIIISGLSFT